MQTRKRYQKKLRSKKIGGTKKKMRITKSENKAFADGMVYFTIEYDQMENKFKIRKVDKANAEQKKQEGLPIYLVELLDNN